MTTFSCTDAELIFLAALSGADHLIGVPDPFHGWLTEEIGPALMEARECLDRRGMITVHPDGSVAIAPDVAPLLEVMTAPERVLLLTSSPDGSKPAPTYFHLGRGWILARKENTLSLLDSAGELSTQIAQQLGLGDQAAAGTSSGMLPAATLQRVRSSVGERGEAAVRADLAAAGLPEETATALAVTLARLVSTGSLAVLFRQQESWDTTCLGLLEGANGLWLLRFSQRDGQDWVEITPADGVTAAQEIHQFLGLLPIA